MFIDACLARSIKVQLPVRLMGHPMAPSVIHSLDVFPEGTLDDVWPPYCKQHNLIPITADGSKSNHGPKLRRIFVSLEIPHFVLTGRIKEAGTVAAMEAIVATWDRVLEAWASPASTRYSIAYNDERTGYRLLKAIP